jgi:hypothetical protein
MICEDDAVFPFRAPSRNARGASVNYNTPSADRASHMSCHRLNAVEHFRESYGGHESGPGKAIACIYTVSEPENCLRNLLIFPLSATCEEKRMRLGKLFGKLAPETDWKFTTRSAGTHVDDAISDILKMRNV